MILHIALPLFPTTGNSLYLPQMNTSAPLPAPEQSPAPAPNPIPRQVKKALSSNLLPDPFTMSRYKFAPYMGCGHACSYCDGRAEKYFVEGDFERDIIYRGNLPELLAKELPRIREYGPIGISSGITDAYQPVEKQLELTRSCAQVLQYYQLPVTILTKSSLIKRDMEYWQQVNQNAGFLLLMTVTTLDQEIAGHFEAGASPIADRLRTLEAFAKAGCSTGALVMPLLPGISDNPEQVRRLYQALVDVGVSCIIPGWLTLRPGRQRNLFFSILDRWIQTPPSTLESPQNKNIDLLHHYSQLYHKDLQSGNPIFSYRQQMIALFHQLTREFKMAPMVPQRVYRRLLNPPDQLYMVMVQMHQWYHDEGLDPRKLGRLQTSLDAYRDWLLVQKRALGSLRGGGEHHDMTALITRAIEDGSLQRVLTNPKLYEYLLGVYRGDQFFEPWGQGRGSSQIHSM